MKKCKICKKPFTPWNTLQRTCSPACAIEDGKKQQEREFKKETKQLKEKVKSRSEWMREAQSAFNRWVRARDADDPCISCGRYHQGQYHAGHYMSVGAHPELRFIPYNNHKQDAPCNTHLSGNLIEYRKRLIVKVGIEVVEWLEGPHPQRKYSIEDLKEIKQGFNQWARELEKQRQE